MAFERKDRVKDTTTTTGTGTVTLTGTAPSGYRAVSAAHTDGATVRYAISAGAEWEVGEGVYTASGTTLSRVTVFASSNAGALVSFSAGTKDVITTLTAQDMMGPSWVIKTTTYTAAAGEAIMADTSGGAWTLTLPASPSANDVVRVADYAGTFATNNLTVARNSLKIMGLSEDMTVSDSNASFTLTYIDATEGWRLT